MYKAASTRSFRCSICPESFSNPRHLGTHILKAHCNDDHPKPGLNNNDAGGVARIIQARLDSHSDIVMHVQTDCKAATIKTEHMPRNAEALHQHGHGGHVIEEEEEDDDDDEDDDDEDDDVDEEDEDYEELEDEELLAMADVERLLAPRDPTDQERAQKFMELLMDQAAGVGTRFMCLVCGKTFTSRYNVSCHVTQNHAPENAEDSIALPLAHARIRTRSATTAGGQNTHLNQYSMQPHLSPMVLTPKVEVQTDDDDDDDDDDMINDHAQAVQIKLEPQIVSVKSMSDLCGPESGLQSGLPNIMAFTPPSPADVLTASGAVMPSLPTVPVPRPELVTVRRATEPSLPSASLLPHGLSSMSVFTCSFCNVRFSEQRLIISHLKEHVPIAEDPTPADLSQGYMTISQCGGKLRSMCLWCGKTFSKEAQVKIHLNVHSGDNIYNCRFCEKVFANFAAFEAHVKTHSEEYKFNCKYCCTAFMNRNVMVSHQKTCPLSTDSRMLVRTPALGGASSPSSAVIKQDSKVKIVLNSDEIKNLIRAKDEELRRQEEATRRAAADVASVAVTAVLQPKVEPSVVSPSSSTSSSSTNVDKQILKPVVRKRAPIFPFEPEDHYVPDNNSNNVINKKEIEPPPTAAERAQGYCIRPFRNGQQRYICIVCGKHYTTTYNMRQHRNIHTGRGLHTCRYCGRDFTHKHVWETHERIHTGERPFRCPTCPKDFADRSNYNSHRKLCAMNKQANKSVTQAASGAALHHSGLTSVNLSF